MRKYLPTYVLFTSTEKYFGRPHKKVKGSGPYHIWKASMVKFERTWPTLKKGKIFLPAMYFKNDMVQNAE